MKLMKFLIAFFFLFFSAKVFACPGTFERLTYDISWFGIKVGTAELVCAKKKDSNGNEFYEIVSTTKSFPLFDGIYKVDSTVISKTETDSMRSFYYWSRQREGSFNRDALYSINYWNKTALFIGKPYQTEIDIEGNVSDPLSVLYSLRREYLETGKSLVIQTVAEKKVWPLEIRVLGTEKISTPLGKFTAIKVQPLLKFNGIFSTSGSVFAWLADDNFKTPILMKTEILVGSITATLRKVSRE